MTKKFLSLVLSLALVVGLMPVMGVQAETVAPVYQLKENFESFQSNDWFNDSFKETTSIDDGTNTPQLSVGQHLKAQIIDTVGYDGKATKAIDIYTNSAATKANSTELGWPNDKATVRLTWKGDFAVPEEGKYVMEFRVFVPGPESGVRRSYETLIAGPCVITMNDSNISFRIGTGVASNQSVNYSTGNYNQWYKLTYVYEVGVLNDSTTHTDAASLYVDDVLKGYREDISAYKSGMSVYKFLRIYSRSNANGSDDVAKEHIIFDDFNFYVPGTTTATSTLKDSNNVKTTDNITVDFDNMILDTIVDGDATVSSDCVAMADAGGNAVEIESVSVSADSKSLVINPKSDLTPATTYNVTVSGLLDMYSQTIDSYSFSFTTAEGSKITSSQPVFTKENLFVPGGSSQTITALENGYIRASYTVTNAAATDKDLIMIVVLKDGDSIKYFQFVPATVAAGGTPHLTAASRLIMQLHKRLKLMYGIASMA